MNTQTHGTTASTRVGTMRIGEVADRVGLSLRTIRHYEDEGLITPAGRTKGRFRLYDEADCTRLSMLRLMKPLEYSLEEMRNLMAVVDAVTGGESPRDPEEVDRLLDRLDTYCTGIDTRARRLAEQMEQLSDLHGQLADLATTARSVTHRRRLERAARG